MGRNEKGAAAETEVAAYLRRRGYTCFIDDTGKGPYDIWVDLGNGVGIRLEVKSLIVSRKSKPGSYKLPTSNHGFPLTLENCDFIVGVAPQENSKMYPRIIFYDVTKVTSTSHTFKTEDGEARDYKTTLSFEAHERIPF